MYKAAITHLYFENIHPFEDSNSRISRALLEKSLSQSAGRPILLSISKVLEKRKKNTTLRYKLVIALLMPQAGSSFLLMPSSRLNKSLSIY